jgi:uncharacterized DUF497 family protein
MSTVSDFLNDVTRAHDSEARFKTTGMIEGKLHVVVATRRGGSCRIISARQANAAEEWAYADR